ncbi:biotin--[acetyl-CoA-carboxylase] synthetase [Candidatus Pantoea edessiphila]|uniref:biotin--[biotin carboxyl-carrier protein] ligase n=1 Tax=Candidatus Pantoea edessiphila TaxID=2044610 RepID=A0A2P5T2Y2_9GAMM|nr:bifunctional biotin--[acetyl-CoA-carboxylase] ligase/biotin operon repressor BirA [Candidatus Pantoea edessiphila]PPI88964.1 biotin--[acetyl-CoA-carboxylase] synthetase [Candidatus Pantoea edessiphila]
MNTQFQLKLAKILSDGKTYSNKYLSKILGTTESIIIKSIKTIKSWGFNIHSINKEKHKLLKSIHLLNEKEIQLKLGKDNVLFFPVIDSTNQYLLDNINYLKSGDICIAAHQKFGRGRYGRSWFSPFGSNIYMSMYWQLAGKVNSMLGISLIIGLLIAEKLQLLGIKDISTKWPNDIYFHGSKLAGVLIELKSKNFVNTQIIIGVGINISSINTLQQTLQVSTYKWISLQEIGFEVNCNRLIFDLVDSFRNSLFIFEKKGFAPFMLRWRKLDSLNNRSVKLVIGKKTIHGIYRGIDTKGSLILENNGRFQSWSVGEISLN